MRRAQYHDHRLNPVAHWTFNGVLTDATGNGHTLQIERGTERYASLLPGVKGFYFDGATNLEAVSIHGDLQITGDMTWVGLIMAPRQVDTQPPRSPSIFTVGDFSGDSTLHQLCDFNIQPAGGIAFFHEYGVSSGETVIIPGAAPSVQLPMHIAWTRSSTHYAVDFNGRFAGSVAYANAPSGGSSSRVRMGLGGMPFAGVQDPFIQGVTLASVQVFDRVLSGDERLQAYHRTLGGLRGSLAA